MKQKLIRHPASNAIIIDLDHNIACLDRLGIGIAKLCRFFRPACEPTASVEAPVQTLRPPSALRLINQGQSHGLPAR
jgi:hypothetical protein